MTHRPPARFYWSLARERGRFTRAAATRWRQSGSAWYRYIADAGRYAADLGADARILQASPQVHDRTSTTPVDAHYVHQGAWVGRHLAARRPDVHLDVGSFVGYLGFFSILAPTVFVDIRPAKIAMPSLAVVGGSLRELPFRSRSVPSLSCLHVLEHVGLGRYGDPIDVNGSRLAARELVRVLAAGGHLYVSLPVGRARTCFNAHRIHDPATVPELFAPLALRECAAVLDNGRFTMAPDPIELASQTYACGLYHFSG